MRKIKFTATDEQGRLVGEETIEVKDDSNVVSLTEYRTGYREGNWLTDMSISPPDTTVQVTKTVWRKGLIL